jgi:hypothetical protein
MDLLAAVLQWNVSPEIISSPVSIRWYSLLFGLSFFLGYYIFVYVFKKEGKKLEDLDDLAAVHVRRHSYRRPLRAIVFFTISNTTSYSTPRRFS